MKRKLDDHDIPTEVASSEPSLQNLSFSNLGLDFRLLQAISKEGFKSPTPVQATAIPLALEGKDILARAQTGSGKTLAYVLPILQSILKRRAEPGHVRTISTLVLVPSRELAEQVTKVIETFSAYCAKNVQVVNLTHQIPDQAQRALLAASPDIVVATPARAATHLSKSTIPAEKLLYLVIDEADQILDFEYGDDFKSIVNLIPKGIHTFLASATLGAEVDKLKGLFCRNPVVVDTVDEEKSSSNLSQYVVRCGEEEKFILIFSLFKLKLVKGKCIIFLGTIDRCYQLKLFLEQFGIKSCVLNSELPVNCRIHVVEEFNKNVYDIIIATDEHETANGSKESTKKDTIEGDQEDDIPEIEQVDEVNSSSDKPSQRKTSGATLQTSTGEDDDAPDNGMARSTKQAGKKNKKSAKKDREYGVSRGIDFQNVSYVLNFDLPTTSKSYIHRIGRTARAGRTGIALSFVIPKSEYRKHRATSLPSTENDERIMEQIMASQKKKGQTIQPHHFEMKKLEAFRYRVASAIKAVSPGAVREARIKEVRQELLKSEKLKRHLEENPEDLQYLRHDAELRPTKIQPHMRHVPDYLMPGGASKAIGEVGFVGMRKQGENRIRNARMKNKFKGKRSAAKSSDPLKNLNARGRR